MKSRRRQKGFTLIELGIVIGVIAILVTVVVIGRGFIQTTQASKVTDGVDVVRKAAATISGMSGGQFAAPSAGNEMGGLVTRGFAPANPWAIIPNWSITDVRWVGGAGAANRVAIQITCPTGQCLNLWDTYNGAGGGAGAHLAGAGDTAGLTCTAAAPAATNAMILCFQI